MRVGVSGFQVIMDEEISQKDAICRLSRDQIPPYLHNSSLFFEFFESCAQDDTQNDDLCDSSSDFVDIPCKYIKMGLTLDSVNDVRHLLSTLRYWCIEDQPDIPDELLAYTLHCSPKEVISLTQTLNDFKDMPFVRNVLIRLIAPQRERHHKDTSQGVCWKPNSLEKPSKLHFHALLHNENEGDSRGFFGVISSIFNVRVCLSREPTLKEHVSKHTQVAPNRKCSFELSSTPLQRPLVHRGSNFKFESEKVSVDLHMAQLLIACEVGSLRCVTYLHEVVGVPLQSPAPYIHVVQGGSTEDDALACMQYLLDHNCPCDVTVAEAALLELQQMQEPKLRSKNSAGGAHACLLYLIEQYDNPLPCQGCAECSFCRQLVELGLLPCIRAISARCVALTGKASPCFSKSTANEAALHGQVACLQYLHEHGNCLVDEWTCVAASRGGYLACLRYAHEQGAPWHSLVCEMAARQGSMDCLQYAHEHGCPWIFETCTGAAETGHLDCLRYAHENGCEWNNWVLHMSIVEGHLDCLKYGIEGGCPFDADKLLLIATEHGRLECLQYLMESAVLADHITGLREESRERIVRGALRGRDFAVHKNETKSAESRRVASEEGCFEYLMQRRFSGVPERVEAFEIHKMRLQKVADAEPLATFLVRRGLLRCLAAVYDRGLLTEWSTQLCTIAAEKDYVDCLRFLHTHGCPWDEDTCDQAVLFNSWACLKYARSHHCPCEWD